MYSDFYGLKTDPFSLSAEPKAFYSSRVHGQGAEEIIRCLKFQPGLILVLGKVGTGKTTLCSYVKEQLSQEMLLASISNPLLSSKQWLKEINSSFGFSATSPNPVLELKHGLSSCLDQDKKAALFIDEGHLLSDDLLEQILVLCNLEKDNYPCLSIVLSGLVELGTRLEIKDFTALRQRVKKRVYLSGLSLNETKSYVRHRLKLFEAKEADLFEPGAVRLIWKKSQGIPRLINQICSKSLERSVLERSPKVSRAAVKACLQERDISTLLPRNGPGKKYAYSVLFLAVLLLFVAGSLHFDLKSAFYLNNKTKQEAKLRAGKAPQDSLKKEESLVSALESLRKEVALLRSQGRSINKEALSLLKEEEKKKKGKGAKSIKSKEKEHKLENRAEENIDDKQEIEEYSLPEGLGDGLKLQAIVWSSQPEARIAVINDKIFSEGEKVEGAKIVQIFERYVQLEKQGLTFYKELSKEIE